MAQLVNSMPPEITELRAASTASGGTVLSTTAGFICPGYAGWGGDYMSITPHRFDGCTVVRYTLNPYLHIIYTTDLLDSVITNLSDEMQDGDTTDNNFAAWGTLASGTALYVGSRVPVRGYQVVMGTTVSNVGASTLTIKYWTPGGWADTANSDGTEAGNVAFAQSGDEIITTTAIWTKDSLLRIGDTLRYGAALGEPLYWTRWETDKAMLANMDIISILPYGRSTAYAEYIEGATVNLKTSAREIGSVEALTDAGAAKLIVNVGTLVGSEFE